MRGVSTEEDWEAEVKMGWPPSVVAEAVRAVWPAGDWERVWRVCHQVLKYRFIANS